jgi:hypothetical protein
MSKKNGKNVDQIRDLIFGTQIREFEEKFNRLEEALHASEARLPQILDESLGKFKKKTERSLEALEAKFDHFSATALKERVKFKERVDATDESLQDQLSNHRDEFEIKLKLIKENMADDHKKISKDLVRMKKEMHGMIESHIAALTQEKLSRESLAQMLLDVAMKLQGTTAHSFIADQLNDGERDAGK